jgi:phage gpG-like protein
MDAGIMSFEFHPSIGVVARGVDRLGLSIRSFREPLKRSVQQVMAPSFAQNFDQGGRPTPWEPWSDSTVEIRSNFGVQGDKVLVRSGRLRRVVQQLNIWSITPASATIKDLPHSVWYGKVQQAGMDITLKGGPNVGTIFQGVRITAPEISIPARPFIMFQDEDYEKVDAVFSLWLQEKIDIAARRM